MIDNFEFIDANDDGEKERFTSGAVQKLNKLSADEANLIRTKLNELVAVTNAIGVPLYSDFALKFKGEGNTLMNAIEVGDIAHRYNVDDGIWDNAIFNGGDPQNPADYTVIPAKPDPILFVSDGLTNEFTIPLGVTAVSLFLDRGMRYKKTTDNPAGEWEQIGTTIKVLGALLASGRKIYITF